MRRLSVMRALHKIINRERLWANVIHSIHWFARIEIICSAERFLRKFHPGTSNRTIHHSICRLLIKWHFYGCIFNSDAWWRRRCAVLPMLSYRIISKFMLRFHLINNIDSSIDILELWQQCRLQHPRDSDWAFAFRNLPIDFLRLDWAVG